MMPGGLGIDLISRERVRRFLKDHGRSRALRLLSETEKGVWRRRGFSLSVFSQFLAAKEAYFKACAGSWLGPEGFAGISVKLLPHRKFRVKSLRPEAAPGPEAGGCFFGAGPWVGAQVMLL
jgi:phosphopantetheinyl transferase (holo-ACP synthase)